MIEFGRRQCCETNWTESLRNIAGDTFSNNAFMNMMSKSMYLTSSKTEFSKQFNIQYQGDVTISKTKEKLVKFFTEQFNDDDSKKIKKLTEEVVGLKAVSLTGIGQERSSKDKQILSSVLFEYKPFGAYIHYFATTAMKKSTFKDLFVLKEEKKKIAKENNITNENLLNLNDDGLNDIVLRGKGIGRFMLYLVQVLSFCNHSAFELQLKTSDESREFYKQCNFFKATIKGSTNNSNYSALESLKCESVITLKDDDNMGKYYLQNCHECTFKDLQKKTINTSGFTSVCYMYSCFQLLSLTFKNIETPRIKEEQMSNVNGYPQMRNESGNNQLFQFPNIFYYSELEEKHKKNIEKFQQQYRDWMTKTITDPCWQRKDRQNDLITMIKTIKRIPRGCLDNTHFDPNQEEDPTEFMPFLLDMHPWEAFMCFNYSKMVLVGANESIDYVRNVAEFPWVETLINLTKSSQNQGSTVKLQEIIQDKFLEKYSDDYDYKGRNNERRIANQIETGLSKGEKLYKMSQLVGLKGNKSVNDQLPQRLLFSKQCYSDSNLPNDNDNTYHAHILHGFTLKDPMCFKVKVGKTENQVGCLRMILKGFIYYTAKEETSERKLNKKKEKKETPHRGITQHLFI